MGPLRRVLRILAAFALGNFLAVNVLSIGKILVHFDNLNFYSHWEYAGGGSIGYALHLLLSTVGSMLTTFIPTLLALIFAETLRIQRRWFYVFGAGVGALLIDVACVKFPIFGGMRSFCVSFSVSEMVIATIAGMTAGYVFWRIAGRQAGQWRAGLPMNTATVA